jgi:hypothetical protein
MFRAYELNDVGEDEWQMVARKGNQFVINDQPFYVNGFNTYWLMVFAADQSTRGKVTEVFQQASSVGLTVCRTWAFNDGQWRALQKSPGVYDEDVFKVLLPSFWAYNRCNLARPLIARLPKLFYFAFLITSHDFFFFFFLSWPWILW